jgi:polyisoprenoid-binding protein YceI
MIRIFSSILCIAMLASCADNSAPSQAESTPSSTPAGDAVSTGLADGFYVINKVKPRVTWAAQKLTGEGHDGTMHIESGKFKVENGNVTEGLVIFDMTRIEVTDLTGDSKADLEGHLRGGDFFNVETHPKAELRVQGITDNAGVKTLNGTLTMNGVAVDYNIPVQLVEAEVPGNAKGLAIQGKFELDRTKHDIIYQSGTFFEGLDWAIKDKVQVGFSIIGVPSM